MDPMQVVLVHGLIRVMTIWIFLPWPLKHLLLNISHPVCLTGVVMWSLLKPIKEIIKYFFTSDLKSSLYSHPLSHSHLCNMHQRGGISTFQFKFILLGNLDDRSIINSKVIYRHTSWDALFTFGSLNCTQWAVRNLRNPNTRFRGYKC